MPNFIAVERCPDLVFVRPRFHRYQEISSGIRAIFRSYTELVEPLSLDEAYLDVTHLDRPATDVATEIRERIREEFRLPSSAGVAPNKLLAKIASDWKKPNGQFVIRPNRIDSFMRELPVRSLWGVGKRAEEKLQKMGCETCGDLQAFELPELELTFGRFGSDLYFQCRGIDERLVQPSRIRKSLSNERTFPDEVTSEAELVERIQDLHEELWADLETRPELRERISGPFVKVKFSDFSQTTVSRTGMPWDLPSFISLGKEAFQRKPRGARLIGLGVRFSERATVLEQMLLPLGPDSV